MKRIIILFLSAVISFLGFSFIDEYEALVTPFLKPKTSGFEGLVSEKELTDNVEKYVNSFNRSLSEAYLAGDEKKISALPMSEELKIAFLEEVSFLKKRGKRLEINFDKIEVVKLNRVSFAVTQVEAREEARVRYHATNMPDDSLPYTKSRYGAIYTLIAGVDGLMVADMEITAYNNLSAKD